MKQRLNSSEVYRHCNEDLIPYETTGNAEGKYDILGQNRAVEAIDFSATITDENFHLYVLGPPGTGRHTIVQSLLKKIAQQYPKGSDWCYVNNFEDTRKPRSLQLPAGIGKQLQKDMNSLIEEIQKMVPSLFEQEEYQTRVAEIEAKYQEIQQKEFEQLRKEAEEKNIAIIHTPAGFTFSPIRRGEIVTPEVFRLLPDSEREEFEKNVEELQKKLQAIIRKTPQLRRQMLNEIRQLNQEVVEFSIESLFDELLNKYGKYQPVVQFLTNVKKDIIQHNEIFLPQQESAPFPMPLLQNPLSAFLERYKVNVLVTHEDEDTAPIIYEEHPNYSNLFGRIEHFAQFGTLFTNFLLIRPGSLHRANGGFLIIDVHRILREPFAWEALKRALFSRQIRIQSTEQLIGLAPTITLEPEPIPLNIKVVLIGERLLFYLLSELDPDFNALFKIPADFEEWIEWSDVATREYSQLLATIAKEKKLLPFDRSAIARIIEHAARLAGHSQRLSLKIGKIIQLMQEANHWAKKAEKSIVERGDVEKAIEKKHYRLDRIQRIIQQEILNNTIFIDTDGKKIGQINGIAVLQLGDFAFGKPSRITATARVGQSGVIDIEREVKLGGLIHSKGVMILANYFTHRYSRYTPVVFSASLTFEQSYGPVEGDSASLAELCVLISALTQIPIAQNFAITGSVNQLGQVQAVGGINEKIEGFFDICKARGLTGQQGVIIPKSNVQHLMLRQDIQQAIEDGLFSLYAVDHVDDAIEILTGIPAGSPDENGEYPENSVNYKVIEVLKDFAEKFKEFSKPEKEQKKQEDNNE